MWTYIWATTPEAAEFAKMRILELVGALRITEPMFAVDWFFLTGRGSLENVAIEEKVDAPLNNLAYPEIHEGVAAFITRFLDSDETVHLNQHHAHWQPRREVGDNRKISKSNPNIQGHLQTQMLKTCRK